MYVYSDMPLKWCSNDLNITLGHESVLKLHLKQVIDGAGDGAGYHNQEATACDASDPSSIELDGE